MFCVCVFIYLIHFADGDSIIEHEICQTPKLLTGNCVIIENCKPIVELFDIAPKPVPQAFIKFIRSYHCGFEGQRPKVCCPPRSFFVSEESTTTTSATTSTTTTKTTATANPISTPPPLPNVSGHKNINLLPKNCGYLDTSKRIVNGNKTGLFQFPWMTLLSYRAQRGPDFKCGGTIINNRYILTAAHCLTDIKFQLIGVRVGDHDINTRVDCEEEDDEQICAPPFQNLAIEEIIPHPNYNSEAHMNDIALLRVAPINLNLENIRPVCLPLGKTRNYNFSNRNGIVTGWGVTEKGRNSPVLLQAHLPMMSIEKCKKIYENITEINHLHLCAGGSTDSDSCAGDSGGPLHAVGSLYDDERLIQQGIVSFGAKDCGQKILPGVYTRVAYYMEWILNNIKP